jgi:hypothetical protein
MAVRRAKKPRRPVISVLGAVASGTVAVGALLSMPAQAMPETGTVTPPACPTATDSPTADPSGNASDAAVGASPDEPSQAAAATDSASASASPTPTCTTESASPSSSPTQTGPTGSSPSPTPTQSGPSATASPTTSASASASAPSTPAAPPPSSPGNPITPLPSYIPPLAVDNLGGNSSPGFDYTGTLPGDTSATLPHGSISRAEILRRAQNWVNEQVPYSESAWWTDSDGTYRQDCSGYVSMAWDLDQDIDFWTGNLNTVSHTIAAADLQPGDILLSESHTILFASWANTAHTEFDYYEESHPGTVAHFVIDAPLSDFLDSGFAPFSFDGVVGSDTPLPATPTNGVNFALLNANGNAVDPNGHNTSEPAPAPWQTAGLGANDKKKTAAPKASTEAVADDISFYDQPLGYVLGGTGLVFIIVGAAAVRRTPALNSTPRRPQRRH